MDINTLTNDYLVFNNDLKYLNALYDESLKQAKILILPAHLVSIGTESFKAFKNLFQVVFPSDLKTIGSYAFFNCVKLKMVDLANTTVTDIKTGAFSCCNIEYLKLSSNLKTIGVDAFANNILSYLNLPLSVEKICPYSFKDCMNLEKLDCSINTHIASHSFENCISLRMINFYNQNNDLEYSVQVSKNEYIKNVESILNGVIITSYNPSTLAHTIYIYCNNKEYIYNDVFTIKEDLSNLLKNDNDIKTFNKACKLLNNEQIKDVYVSYFGTNLEKLENFINNYALYQELCLEYCINDQLKIIALLDELGTFNENSFMLKYLELLCDIKSLDVKMYIIKYLKAYAEIDMVRKSQLLCQIDFNKIAKQREIIDNLMKIPEMSDYLDEILIMLSNYNYNILDYETSLLNLSTLVNNSISKNYLSRVFV